MSGRGDGSNSGNDTVIILFFAMGMVAVLIWGIWYLWHTHISFYVMTVRYWQTMAIWWVKGDETTLGVLQWIGSHRPSDVEFSQLVQLSQYPNLYLRWVVVPVIGFLAWRAWKHKSLEKMFRRKIIGLDALIKEQSRSWPVILPIVVDNPTKDKKGRWLPAMNERDWLRFHGIPAQGPGGVDPWTAGDALAMALPTTSGFSPFDIVASFAEKGVTYVTKGKTVDSEHVTRLLRTKGIDLDAMQDQFGDTDPDAIAFAAGQHMAIRAALARQLRYSWQGPSRLQPVWQALFALYALYGARMKSEADDLRDRLAKLYADEFVNHAKHGRSTVNMDKAIQGNAEVKRIILSVLRDDIEAIVPPAKGKGKNLKKALEKRSEYIATVKKDGGILGPALEVCNRHYYAETALWSLLAWCRVRVGVVPSAETIWVKPVNRSLWYLINSVGRRRAWIEAAGVMSHWKAECAKGQPIPSPEVAAAAEGLRLAFVPED